MDCRTSRLQLLGPGVGEMSAQANTKAHDGLVSLEWHDGRSVLSHVPEPGVTALPFFHQILKRRVNKKMFLLYGKSLQTSETLLKTTRKLLSR